MKNWFEKALDNAAEIGKGVGKVAGATVLVAISAVGAAAAMEAVREQAKNYKEKGLSKDDTALLLKNKYGDEYINTINSVVNSIYSAPSAPTVIVVGQTSQTIRGKAYLRVVFKGETTMTVLGPYGSDAMADAVWYDIKDKCSYGETLRESGFVWKH